MAETTSMNPAFHNFPRNSKDYFGGIVLFDATTDTFVKLEWGIGDNLLKEDRAAGYDDYINYETWGWAGGPLAAAFRLLDRYEGDFESIEDDYSGGEKPFQISLAQCDGGMLLVRRKDKGTGDIREYIRDVMELIGFDDLSGDGLVFVCSLD